MKKENVLHDCNLLRQRKPRSGKDKDGDKHKTHVQIP